MYLLSDDESEQGRFATANGQTHYYKHGVYTTQRKLLIKFMQINVGFEGKLLFLLANCSWQINEMGVRYRGMRRTV